MYKLVWLYNTLEELVIIGGISFAIYLIIIEFCDENKRKILKIAYGALFVTILLLSMFGIDDKIRKPDMDESLYGYTESVISLVDTVAKDDMPLESFSDILGGYVDSFDFTKSTTKRTKLEQDIYLKIFFIHNNLTVEYEAEFNGKWKDKYGYRLTWYDLDANTQERIIELRNELAELIKLPPYYDEDNFRREDKLGYFD